MVMENCSMSLLKCLKHYLEQKNIIFYILKRIYSIFRNYLAQFAPVMPPFSIFHLAAAFALLLKPTLISYFWKHIRQPEKKSIEYIVEHKLCKVNSNKYKSVSQPVNNLKHGFLSKKVLPCASELEMASHLRYNKE